MPMNFGKFYLMFQTIHNIVGMRHNILDNLSDYADKIRAGVATADQIKQTIQEDVIQYQRRLGWITPLLNAAQDKAVIEDALAAARIPTTELQEAHNQLTAAVSYLSNQIPNITKAEDLGNIKQSIKAMLPNYKKLW